MPQDTKARIEHASLAGPPIGAPDLTGAPAATQGLIVDARDESQLRHAIELAFHYRGDVTIFRRSTGETVQGYLFDRDWREDLARSVIRIMPTAGGRVTIACDDIQRLEFTGRDTAAGKSFETWLRKYVERKMAGQAASIEAESLDAESTNE